MSNAENLATFAAAAGGPISLRNRLINGAFNINQRVYASGAATSGANQYTLDRWRVVVSGQSLAYSASGLGNQITAPAGGVEQVISANNIEGGTYCLSWVGTATATINGSAIANGGTVTLAAATNATVRFSNGTVSLAQLEIGGARTGFEYRPFAFELMLCQRYYEKSYDYATAPGTNTDLGATQVTGDATNTSTIPGVRYGVRKHASPTFTFYSKLGTISKVSNIALADVTPTTPSSPGGESGTRSIVSGSAVFGALQYLYQWTAEAEL